MSHLFRSIRGVTVLVALTGCVTNVPGTNQRPAETVVFAPLPVSRMQVDCATAPAESAACRVKRVFSSAELRARLDVGTSVWSDGDELTFAYEGAADAVSVTSGLQYPMSRIEGTHLWVVTIRVRGLDRAVVSYAFVPSGKGIPRVDRIDLRHWRGPLAPRVPPSAASLAGRIVHDTLASQFLPAPRAVEVYVPPARNDEPITGVVYLGDGGITRSLAPFVDTLISTGQLPRVLLVGIENAHRSPTDPEDFDPRAMEYLRGFDRTDVRFVAHERFLIREVIPWAERRFHVPAEPARRATFGVSNSGAWAIDMALRHPDVIGRVIAFSPGGRHGQLEEGNRVDTKARFYLQGGTLEPAFLSIAHNWADTLRSRGASVTLHEVVGGHDSDIWAERFSDALRWMWPRTTRATIALD